jgi:phosphoribosylamine--glycine ligase
MTRVLLIGGGAREHAMAEAIVRSEDAQLVVVAKHRNPGIARIADSYHIHDECDVPGVVAIAQTESIDIAVIGPEAPEEAGLADALEAARIACASPTKAAARIETDKQFMRDLMERHQVPGRLGFHPFENADAACKFLDENGPIWAIKPIGLTGGKGVQVHGDHFTDVEGAKAYTRSIFESGAGGGHLQFEELAVGEEFTLMALTDGTTVLPMVACQDHKRLYEGDKGPNTGGMGSYSDANGLLPFLTSEDRNASLEIVHGLVDALRADGCPYVGAIYGQFMLTQTGPKVIEVNARFGDPEAMNVLHLLESDYVDLLSAMANGTLSDQQGLAFRPHATVVKYLVPQGYGNGKPSAGTPVSVDEDALAASGASIYYASIQESETGGLETLTSRTMGVVGVGATIAEAEQVAEAGLKCVTGDLVVRHDIGTAKLIQQRVKNMDSIRGVAA